MSQDPGRRRIGAGGVDSRSRELWPVLKVLQPLVGLEGVQMVVPVELRVVYGRVRGVGLAVVAEDGGPTGDAWVQMTHLKVDDVHVGPEEVGVPAVSLADLLVLPVHLLSHQPVVLDVVHQLQG